uniref:FMRFamide-related neuropeptides n=1 Tax=Sepia officinalis TaxID=6610 RepID=FMRF_SEPOF|nr:RecName: Full=FMRFamide-related neuropeptides; Contains: RecName: Full=FIRF-amide; Contains: RecName: Full=ALSGDAFLRF-amide; Contains: RecName: Full=FLRF-amide; Contains: RecName: Full=FMRF-amide 1; Contains: RecName: Full=FMRF-amide 2; Contains: RecName: Full=FMRF-amide 3; Contains: RecName: Full=FMRF-amide 4; Contains: RecName: Full=FMRF-amide 5; Contains: RecName: Full=FMRF-amide 6; Contains: RecName: Full=FMRF-amide 7; Contains: RecName: Full=FMRF-amide 8; Contains: RecName: Full=FMRF-amide 
MRCWSPCSLLVVIAIYCLSSHTSEAFDLAQACVESQRLSLLPICDTIFAVQQEGAQQSADDGLRSKRFIRFGRALSGDAFLRFGKNVPDLPFEDKRFLRFGRAAPQLDDLLKQALQRVESLQKSDDTSVRRKRSTDAAPQSNTDSAEQKNDSAKITKRYVDDVEDSDVKRFMRFGKRFMRFGRNPSDVGSKLTEKRFMRFGRDPEKRFMRFGKSDDKKFMRFGRNPGDAEDELEEDKRFMRFGRGDEEDEEEAEKRFMRFGRDPEKKFMRFGKNGEEKRFMRFGRNPEEPEADKRFMRFGRGGEEDDVNTEEKRFMRFGRSAEKCKGCLEG